MVILRKLALSVQANLRAHPGKIKNAASLLETTFEPFNYHRDLRALHRDSSSVSAAAGASGRVTFNVRSPRQPFDGDVAQEFLKEHRKVEQRRKDSEAAIAQQQKQIDALTAGLQKLSAELEVSKPAPQTVLNNQ